MCIRDRRWGGGRAARTIEGVSVAPTAPQQWWFEEVFRCHEDEQVDTCDVPDNATLVSAPCLETIDGGTCSLFRNNFSVELPDPSGGCHEYTEEYLCTDAVANAGTPIATPTVESGAERDFSACEPLSNSFEPVSGSGLGSVHRYDFDTPEASSWIQIENNTWLHLGEINIWGLNASGQTVDYQPGNAILGARTFLESCIYKIYVLLATVQLPDGAITVWSLLRSQARKRI